MDVLTLGGKNYVKASVIARDLGYTADYVGQLCRSGKVDATLVGRSWYVHKDSIHDHKRGRYRSTQSKSSEELRNTIRVNESEPVNISHFYTHHERSTGGSAKYISDDSELMPQLAGANKKKKDGELNIQLADASEVKVKSSEGHYQFKTPKLPPIRFTGQLKVDDYEEQKSEPVPAPVGGLLVHPKEVEVFKSTRKAKRIVISEKPDVTVIEKKPIFGNRLSHLAITDLDLEKAEEVIPAHRQPIPESNDNLILFRFLLFVVFLCASVLSLVLISLETHVSVSGSSYSTTFQVNFHNLSILVDKLFTF